MFVEKIGRFLFNRIRLPFFLLLLSVGPVCVGVFLFMEKQSVDLLWEQLEIGKMKAKTAIDRKERKERFTQRHLESDPYFLNKELESLSFLEEEKINLKKWLNHPGISRKDRIAQRVRFLENGENKLVFQEEEIRLSKLYKETVEKQKSPIEIDANDLKKLLSLIEDLPSENLPLTRRPQLIISEFSMHKKTTPFDGQAIEVKLDLFKREFLSP